MHKKSTPSGAEQIHDKTAPNESIHYLNDNVKSEAALWLGRMAHEAIVEEIETSPKPGLVDSLSCGCHRDMDIGTFMRSAAVLEPFWAKQAEIGFETTGENAMNLLRETGVRMERAMFDATCGVNTHKGMIYLMSLLIFGAAALTAEGERPSPETTAERAANIVKKSVDNEFSALRTTPPKRKLTNGERLFLEHGIKGARGEAASAFPCVIKAGLPRLRGALADGASGNNAAISALLAIMEANEDSNVIHRGGHDFWKNEYRRIVRAACEKFDPLKDDFTAIEELESHFTERDISPGGAADLLACTIFIDKISASSCQH